MFTINQDTCINCGLCTKTCRLNGADIIKHDESKNKPYICLSYCFIFASSSTDDGFLVRTGKNSCFLCHECLLICPTSSISDILRKDEPEKIMSLQLLEEQILSTEESNIEKIKKLREHLI